MIPRISRNAVKEGFDTLPAAICYFDRNGLLRLINHRMQEIAAVLCGRDLQTLTDLEQALHSPGGGVQLRYFILLGALVAVSVPVLWKFVLSEYQIKRFTSVYNLDDPSIQLNEGYQQVQGRISIGSGQLTGKGLFNGPRVETNLVTFQHSDFIFSVAGEELGFIGCTAIIVLLLVYLLRVLYIASKARDDLGRCMCFGFFGLIALQSVSNIGMCLALLPVMGVTLPFFSAGGSSAVCLYLGFGLIQSVYMHRPDANVPHLRSTRTLKMNFRKLNA